MSGKIRYSLRSFLLAVALLAAILAVVGAIWRWSKVFSVPPAPIEELEQIVAQGMPIVEAIDAYQRTHGHYPESLQDAGVAEVWTGHGLLNYYRYRERDDGYPNYELSAYLGKYSTLVYGQKGEWTARTPRGYHHWTKAEALRIVAVPK